jgi:hypothetical protein
MHAGSNAVCDFCRQPHPVKCYRATSFILPAYRFISEGDWAACASCHSLLQAGKYRDLVARMANPYDCPADIMKELLDAFLAAWTGQVLEVA